jgi:hypothetical protein
MWSNHWPQDEYHSFKRTVYIIYICEPVRTMTQNGSQGGK